jgi:outer membrane protein OmpA-like peptidoglycan-associated protein
VLTQYGDGLKLTSSGGSGSGATSYQIINGPCVISAGVLESTAAGKCTVTITKAGDTQFLPATATGVVLVEPLLVAQLQEPSLIQSTLTKVSVTLQWPGTNFEVKFCLGKKLNSCQITKSVVVTSQNSVPINADGDLLISSEISGLKPRIEYHVYAVINAGTKVTKTSPRLFKTPAGITIITSGVTDLTLGESFDIGLNVTGEGKVISMRATGLPLGVTLAKSQTGATIIGKARTTGIFFVSVRMTDTFRQITQIPVVISVRAIEAEDLISGAIYRPVTAKTTLVSWKNDKPVSQTVIKIGDRVVCTTTATTCLVGELLGPKSKPQIIANGTSGIMANPVLPIYVAPKKLVEVGVANFASNSTRLSTAQRNALKKVASDMEVKGFTQLTVYGYSDLTGTKAVNDKISLARSTAIYSYLKILLDEKNLTVTLIGRGFKDPVASNATAKGRAANRRAVVSIG